MVEATHRGRSPVVVLAAVPQETLRLRELLELTPSDGLSPFAAFSGGGDTLLLHTGVGKVNAASAATALLERITPRAIIVCGCGGAYPDSGLRVGDLAVATAEIFGDEGVSTPTGFQDMAALDLPLLTTISQTFFNTFPVNTLCVEHLQSTLDATAAACGARCVSGPFVTVSTCSGRAALGAELAQRTGGICENMEGAAIASVCTRYTIPLLEIRGISNLTEDRDLTRWDLRGAATLAQQAVIDLLPLL
ncbi:MAG: futalosine hydrolase [Desulfuromonadales bacterium]|nr:futalosine hydrolase [Desulfuromonadales bacterium]